MTLIVIPDELDAMIESVGVAASMSANNLILKSGRSGPFSWTRSASDNAFFMSEVKVSLSREAFFASPMAVRSGHAASIYSRRFLSAFGAGSVAITSKPHAKYCAAQLAPIAPVPTIAIRRTGLSNAIICVLLCPKALEPAIPRLCVGIVTGQRPENMLPIWIGTFSFDRRPLCLHHGRDVVSCFGWVSAHSE